MATLVSILIYNAMKFFFILIKLRIQPFSWSTVWVIAIALGVFVLVTLVPAFSHPLVDIILRSALITLLFVSPVLYFRFSPDLNQLAAQGWQKIRERLHF